MICDGGNIYWKKKIISHAHESWILCLLISSEEIWDKFYYIYVYNIINIESAYDVLHEFAVTGVHLYIIYITPYMSVCEGNGCNL